MSKLDLSNALFFDIETHAVVPWEERTPAVKQAFINHYYDPQSYSDPGEHYSEVAGLYPEFSHVICIVFGHINKVDNKFVTADVHGIDEIKLLTDARKIFDAFEKSGFYLAGHNINNCDCPYLAKRYIINRMKIPHAINNFGLKPWELSNLDTMDLWKFGDYKRVSLECICSTLDVNCKTDDLGGSNLYQYDINKMPWDTLVHYCTEDVVSNFKMTKMIADCM